MKELKGIKLKKLWSIGIFAIIIFLILLSTVAFLISYRQLNQNIQQERKNYVSEISRQLDSNISMVRSMNLRLSALLADTLSNVRPDTFESCNTLLQSKTKDGSSVFYVTEDGTVLSAAGAVVGVDNRDYVSQVLQQEHYSAFERIGRENEYWLFSALLADPCVVENQKIQAVILAWDKESYSKNVAISIFDGLGYSFLIKGNGVITVSLESVNQGRIGFNILTTLQENGIELSVYNRLLSDLKSGKDNALVCKLGDVQWLLQYHQLEEGSFTFIMLPLTLTAVGTYQGLTATMLFALSIFLLLALLVIGVILYNTKREKLWQEEMYQITLDKKAVEAKNDFLAKMSHDIRTPLNGIIGMNYIAASKVGKDDEAVAASLKKIETASQYLLSLINDILDMSKIASGKMELSNQVFSLEKLLENIQNMLEITSVEKKLEFRTAFHMPCVF